MGGGAVGQRGGLLVRARRPQAVQQVGHGGRVAEGGMGGDESVSAAACRVSSTAAGLAAGWRRRPGRRGRRGRHAVGQRGGLLVRARPPQG